MADMTNLFRLMDKRGIKAIQLSKDTGISSGLISEWKKGLKTPAAKNLKILCEYFDVSEAFILGYTNEPNEKSAQSEENALDNEIMQLFAALPADKQAEALNYLKYLASKDKS